MAIDPVQATMATVKHQEMVKVLHKGIDKACVRASEFGFQVPLDISKSPDAACLRLVAACIHCDQEKYWHANTS